MANAIPLQLEYLFYILSIPILFIIIIWTSYYSKSFLDFFRSSENVKKRHKRARIVKTEKEKMRKYESLFAVILLILILSLSPIASDISDKGVHRELKGENALELVIVDPVIHSLGPSYNTEKIRDEMEENPNIWMPEEVDQYIDLEKITRFPGSLAVYRLYGGRYIITYTYLGPFPITKAYGFLLSTQGNEIISFSGEDTILYPFNPAKAGDVAD